MLPVGNVPKEKNEFPIADDTQLIHSLSRWDHLSGLMIQIATIESETY